MNDILKTIPTEDLADELLTRFDAVAITGMLGNEKGGGMLKMYSGDIIKVVGLMDIHKTALVHGVFMNSRNASHIEDIQDFLRGLGKKEME